LSDKDKSKPVTLADYIPPEPAPASKRSTTSKRNRDRLDALDREVRDDDAQRTKSARRYSGKKKPNLGTIFFYGVLLVIILLFID
jgi:hypothetical protein